MPQNSSGPTDEVVAAFFANRLVFSSLLIAEYSAAHHSATRFSLPKTRHSQSNSELMVLELSANMAT